MSSFIPNKDPSSIQFKTSQIPLDSSTYPLLRCEAYGGPSVENSHEMVYWKHVFEKDVTFTSPYIKRNQRATPTKSSNEKFLTFEPDDAGWNNIRMGFETVIAMAIVMGRTLVLPPNQPLSVIWHGAGPKRNSTDNQKNTYNFYDFYNLTRLTETYENLKIVTMDQYLEEQGLTGKLKSQITLLPLYPPANEIHWEITKASRETPRIYSYLREVGFNPLTWKPNKCLATFPDPNSESHDQPNIETIMDDILNLKDGRPFPHPHHFYQRPTAVSAPPVERLRESLADRTQICNYDTEMQWQRTVHFRFDMLKDIRLLTHFYSFLFHENYHQDLFIKRFVRDGVRYNDVIMCAAAKIVDAIRKRAQQRNPTSNANGEFDTFHIRRNDFQAQFKSTKGGIEAIYEHSKVNLKPGSTIFIATDEENLAFFEPLKEIYDLVFLEDFLHLFSENAAVEEYHWGMVEQMVAARGRIFHGLFYSTFSAYIMRLRGYYSVKENHATTGDLANSFYYIPRHTRNEMSNFRAVRLPSFLREYPVAWRDIDNDVQEKVFSSN